MSEKVVGYTTIGGDLMGTLVVLANVPKMVVMALLGYLSERTGYEGIKAVLAKPELAPERLRSYVEKLTRLFLGSINKWMQAPISLHIGNLDLDRVRALQLPVVQSRARTREPAE